MISNLIAQFQGADKTPLKNGVLKVEAIDSSIDSVTLRTKRVKAVQALGADGAVSIPLASGVQGSRYAVQLVQGSRTLDTYTVDLSNQLISGVKLEAVAGIPSGVMADLLSTFRRGDSTAVASARITLVQKHAVEVNGIIFPKGLEYSCVTDQYGTYFFSIPVDADYDLSVTFNKKVIYRNTIKLTKNSPKIEKYLSLIFPLSDELSKYMGVKESFRFNPKYWTVDGQRSTNSSIVSLNSRGFRVDSILRKKNDLVGILWFSKDTLDHFAVSYREDRDYRNVVWSFNLRLAENLPPIEATNGLVLTVSGNDINGVSFEAYVRLANYTYQTGRDVLITLDFNTIAGGYYADVPFYAGDITSMFFGLTTPEYDSGQDVKLDNGEFETWIEVDDIQVSGFNSVLMVNSLDIKPHELAMCTAYDDSYNQNPERIIENTYNLGYRDWINHYVGMSHFYNVSWSDAEFRFRVDTTKPRLNSVAAKWHDELFKAAKRYGYKVINAVSYEIFATACPYEWTQRDYSDDYARTNYSEPSYLLSPSIEEARNYIADTMLEFSSLAVSRGLEPYLQIGEPWWWFNANGKPCFYDYPTRLKYFNETGKYAPEIYSINAQESELSSDHFEYLAWLEVQLGLSNLYIRDRVKATLPAAKMSLLFFLPTILDESVGIMRYCNYPVEYYAYPNWDFMQTECYDWVTTGQLEKAKQGYTRPIDELQYPKHLIQYLAGFATTKDALQWRYIFESIKQDSEFGIGKLYIWAYPQVMQHNITYFPDDNVFYMDRNRNILAGVQFPAVNIGKVVSNIFDNTDAANIIRVTILNPADFVNTPQKTVYYVNTSSITGEFQLIIPPTEKEKIPARVRIEAISGGKIYADQTIKVYSNGTVIDSRGNTIYNPNPIFNS